MFAVIVIVCQKLQYRCHEQHIFACFLLNIRSVNNAMKLKIAVQQLEIAARHSHITCVTARLRGNVGRQDL